jgi:tRNA threonylcarbamoyladenosine biosynthesis protein TsaB
MRVLAFDTATAATVAAFGEIERRDDPPAGTRPAHAQKLLSLIQAVLDESQAGWGEVDRIAVGVGPGTFTGLRIGIATAQAIARATGIELVGVSTLASLELAASTAPGTQQNVLAVIDARRNEAFVAGAGLQPCVLTPAALGEVAGQRASDGVTAVGDGAVKFRSLLEAVGAAVPPDDSALHRVSAIHHCRLALDAAPAVNGVVEPQYLRRPDAELAQKQ